MVDCYWGRRVLVTGAAGGVGRFAVQLGALSGARITAIAGSPERSLGLDELGANEIVMKIADAQGLFDLILESVGGSSLETAIQHIAPGGTIVLFGGSSTQDAKINLFAFAGHRLFFILYKFIHLNRGKEHVTDASVTCSFPLLR